MPQHEKMPTKHFRSYDRVLGKWFQAETESALMRLMNDPQFVQARQAKQREYAVAAYHNQRYGLTAIQKAEAIRQRKREKNLRIRDQQQKVAA